jgi:thiol-disulfide isomerase/thioredoxin
MDWFTKAIRKTRTARKKKSPPTRKNKKGYGVIKVSDESQLKEFEEILKKPKVKVILIYAEWCGACHKFMDNIWNPMCGAPAKHERGAISSELVEKSSLAKANYNYLPSVILVNEEGKIQEFSTETGEPTHVIPTPKTLDDMKRIVNIPVAPIMKTIKGAMNSLEQYRPSIEEPAKINTRLYKAGEAAENILNKSYVPKTISK